VLEDGRHDIHLTDDGDAVIGHDGPTFGTYMLAAARHAPRRA
jgi:hypothetical protein